MVNIEAFYTRWGGKKVKKVFIAIEVGDENNFDENLEF